MRGSGGDEVVNRLASCVINVFLGLFRGDAQLPALHLPRGAGDSEAETGAVPQNRHRESKRRILNLKYFLISKLVSGPVKPREQQHQGQHQAGEAE